MAFSFQTHKSVRSSREMLKERGENKGKSTEKGKCQPENVLFVAVVYVCTDLFFISSIYVQDMWV